MQLHASLMKRREKFVQVPRKVDQVPRKFDQVPRKFDQVPRSLAQNITSNIRCPWPTTQILLDVIFDFRARIEKTAM
jgi:hypothetical protein